MRSLISVIAWLLVGAMVDVAAAQQPGRVYKIGFLIVGGPDFVWPPMQEWTGPGATLRDELRDRGYVLGKNLVVELRHAHGDVARLAKEVEALVASNVDVIVPGGTAPTVTAMQVTKRIPIVFNGVGSPVEKGVVESLNKPGGNVTGMAVSTSVPKLWQMLKEIAPATKRGGALLYGPNSIGASPDYWSRVSGRYRSDASAAGIQFVDMRVNTRDDISARFLEMAAAGDGGIVILTDNTLFSWRSHIIDASLRHRLPTVCGQWLGWGPAGCVAT